MNPHPAPVHMIQWDRVPPGQSSFYYICTAVLYYLWPTPLCMHMFIVRT